MIYAVRTHAERYADLPSPIEVWIVTTIIVVALLAPIGYGVYRLVRSS